MARRKRLHSPGATYHVMLRGNAGEQIFDTFHDRCKMCFLIQEGIERYGHRLLAYCFMSNHVHFAIQVGQVSLSRIIQNLSFRYTRHMNRKRERIGHLFQGRFKSILVDSERYIKELVRYIHLNPVRAGIVQCPDQYKWSSHNVYLGKDPMTWLTTSYLLKRFGDDQHIAVKRFNNYVLGGIGVTEEIDYKRGVEEGILGDDNFIERVRERVEFSSEVTLSLDDIVNTVCDKYCIKLSVLKEAGKIRKAAHVRSVLSLLVRETNHLTLEELGHVMGQGASSLSKLATRLNTKRLLSSELDNEISKLKLQLIQMSECQA